MPPSRGHRAASSPSSRRERLLTPDALRVVTRAFRATACDVLYGDEDEQDERWAARGYRSSNPDGLRICSVSRMYWSDAVFYRRSTLAALLPLQPDPRARMRTISRSG